MAAEKLRVAVVGMRFGESFAPIYRDHPDVGEVAICDTDRAHLDAYGDKFGFANRYYSLDELLKSGEWDAVHLTTPIPLHEEQTVAVLESGRHCACTVPAATTVDGLRRIVAAQEKSGKRYMMMETSVYTFQCLLARQMAANDEFGRIQFLRGAHYQDMEFWPDYWLGLPPMHYATHAIAPLLAVAGARATKVHCFGSGVMRDELHAPYGNPFPVETAIFQLDKENLAAEVTRTLFHTAREYMESFNIYGEKASLEWHMEDEPIVRFDMEALGTQIDNGRGKRISWQRVANQDFSDLLPKEIAHHSVQRVIMDPDNPHLSVIQGGGHHGSHPHMVHEFVRSIVEDRKPWIDVRTAANWTAAGVCAHTSAMNGGEAVEIPDFYT